MELKTLIGILCVGLSFLLSARVAHTEGVQNHVGFLQSRKLKGFHSEGVTAGIDVRGDGDDSKSYYKPDEADLSGNPRDRKEARAVHAKGTTWREWVESNKDSSEFSTMDYTCVRRRRPIHNKSLPTSTVAP